MTGPGLTLDDKRWAQRANALQFEALTAVRSAAERWRNGLTALTSLLAVTSIIAAPGLADRLAGGWRALVGGLTLAGLVALLYGTWEALGAAFGVPDTAIALTGERLRGWESKEATRGVAALRRARIATLMGILLLIATAGTSFFAAKTGTGPTVRVNTGGDGYCGTLGGGRTEGTVTVTGRDGTVHTIAITDITSIANESAC